MSAVIATGAGKAVGEDAALQILLERHANIGLWGVVVALAVELTCAGELMPGLEVLGNGLVEQRAFGVARVVELWFGTCCRGHGRRTVARLVVRMGSAV